MSDSDIANMLLANQAANQARSETAAANLRTREAEQLMWAERMKNLTADSPDEDMKRRLKIASSERDTANMALKCLDEKSKAALAEKDALILEWMHSTEAFKRLARQYGKKLGVTDEQRQQDFDNNVLNVAEEDVIFENTKKTAGAKKRLGLEKK